MPGGGNAVSTEDVAQPASAPSAENAGTSSSRRAVDRRIVPSLTSSLRVGAGPSSSMRRPTRSGGGTGARPVPPQASAVGPMPGMCANEKPEEQRCCQPSGAGHHMVSGKYAGYADLAFGNSWPCTWPVAWTRPLASYQYSGGPPSPWPAAYEPEPAELMTSAIGPWYLVHHHRNQLMHWRWPVSTTRRPQVSPVYEPDWQRNCPTTGCSQAATPRIEEFCAGPTLIEFVEDATSITEMSVLSLQNDTAPMVREPPAVFGPLWKTVPLPPQCAAVMTFMLPP